MSRIFPSVLMLLDVCAALAYVPSADWRRVVYWLAAAVITASVTF
jgi:hypothetical protein